METGKEIISPVCFFNISNVILASTKEISLPLFKFSRRNIAEMYQTAIKTAT